MKPVVSSDSDSWWLLEFFNRLQAIEELRAREYELLQLYDEKLAALKHICLKEYVSSFPPSPISHFFPFFFSFRVTIFKDNFIISRHFLVTLGPVQIGLTVSH